MRQLPRIKAAYDWFYAQWQSEAAEATRADDMTALTKLEEKPDVLEHGVFVLMFGQFEIAVDDVFAAARQVRIGNPDWTSRRGWDAGSLQGRKVPFETKLSLVLDRRSNAFGNVLATYARRNHCAHGGMSAPIGGIDALETDLYAWHGEQRG